MRRSPGRLILLTLGAATAIAAVVLLVMRLGPKAPSGPPLNFKIADIDPIFLDKQDAQLVLSGTKLPVTLEVEKAGDKTTVRSMAFGEALESEVYRVTDESIELTGAIGETYDPPVLLLKTDLHQGESWEWEGKISSQGATPYSAHAQLTVNLKLLNLPGIDDNAIYVQMILYIEGVGPKPAKRELGFWFVPQKGLIRRDFGGASTRMPLAPEGTAEEPGG